jgi:hypothetical protein
LTAHQFVFTATNDQITTYGWGENSIISGRWQQNTDLDRAAASRGLNDGWAQYDRVGDSSLDPFVALAYDNLSQEAPHMEFCPRTCQGESERLVEAARELQAIFMTSRQVGTDSLNGAPVYDAPAVSDFRADGSPIYAPTWASYRTGLSSGEASFDGFQGADGFGGGGGLGPPGGLEKAVWDNMHKPKKAKKG